MTDLDRYLARATAGLLGRRRRAVREELRANILHHTRDLQIGGLTEPEAIRCALRDFGSPARLSLGLLRVHTLPVMLTALLLASSVGTVALGLTIADGRHEPTRETTAACEPAHAPPHPATREAPGAPSSCQERR